MHYTCHQHWNTLYLPFTLKGIILAINIGTRYIYLLHWNAIYLLSTLEHDTFTFYLLSTLEHDIFTFYIETHYTCCQHWNTKHLPFTLKRIILVVNIGTRYIYLFTLKRIILAINIGTHYIYLLHWNALYLPSALEHDTFTFYIEMHYTCCQHLNTIHLPFTLNRVILTFDINTRYGCCGAFLRL